MNLAELHQIAEHYRAILKRVPLRPPCDETEYERAVEALNGLLDAGGADENHALAGLAAALGACIGEYESRRYPPGNVPPRRMLAILMEEHGLRQSDLPEVGSQGVISELLAGKREISLRQARALARRFKAPVSLFV